LNLLQGQNQNRPHFMNRAMPCGLPVQRLQLLRMGHVQPVVEHAFCDREDGRVRAHGQCQRSHGNQGASWAFAQYAETIADILEDSRERQNRARFSIALLQQCGVTKLAACGGTGIFRTHAPADKLLCHELKVNLDLTIEFGFRFLLSDEDRSVST
jgi:hypothetical protein